MKNVFMPMAILNDGWVVIVAGLVVLILLALILRWVFSLRRVVSPNEVHIVRQGRKTLVYGDVKDNSELKDKSVGNSYYQWPIWMPVLGVNVSVLPLAVFDINLQNYNTYDKDRLPFVVDIQAYFRISDYTIAATRIRGISELKSQLMGILQGATRALLANEELETIMGERSKYGSLFTTSIQDQLPNWGVETVKNIELMDIRDAESEVVIENIMKKKKSDVDKQSRITVAQNSQAAQEAEILAQQEVDLKAQDAKEKVGKREAEVSATVGIEKERAEQKIKDEAKLTKEKEMAIQEVEKTRMAEIDKIAKITEAEKNRKQIEIAAEAEKAKLISESSGQLSAAENQAKGIEAIGKAEAEAEKLRQMASVTAQTALAKEIGDNNNYQEYLVKKQQIEANERVGLEQAQNLKNASIKIIAGAGDVNGGITSAASALSPKGGFALGTMLEAMGATEEGQAFLTSLRKIMESSGLNPLNKKEKK